MWMRPHSGSTISRSHRFSRWTASQGTRSSASWDAVHLENRWLRLMGASEIGGRIHIGFDKVAKYDFFYRNNVIKPALVGLTGPPGSPVASSSTGRSTIDQRRTSRSTWRSRIATTALSQSVLDDDPFHRMKGMHGITLYAA